MTRINLLTIAVFGLLAINIGLLGVLFFRTPPPLQRKGHAHLQEGPKEFIIKKLQFDSNQAKQYDALVKEHRSTIQALDKAIMDAKQSLYLTLANKLSDNKDSLMIKINSLKRPVEETHYNHFTAIKHLCKPAQLQSFKSLSEELAGLFSPRKNFSGQPKD